MPRVLSVTTSRVRDGKWQEAMAVYGKLRNIIERLGGDARFLTQTYGAAPGTITTVVEFSDWADFGVFSDRAAKDKEFQSVVASLRADPISDFVARGVSTELEF